MKFVRLGDLDVSRIGLGAMGMSFAYTGAGSDDEESVRTIHRALDLGFTFIDTAEVYGPYTNEETGRPSRQRPSRRSGARNEIRDDLTHRARTQRPRSGPTAAPRFRLF
jgi:aryl-alcohol dehydrogenase-like predicted oxidoreductase